MSENTKRVEVTIAESHARRLREEYGTSLSLAEAIRQANEEALRARETQLSREDVTDAIVDAIAASQQPHADD